MTLPRTCKDERKENTAGVCSGADIKIETYVCNDCGKEFTTESSLIAHMNSHNFNDNELDEQRNSCSICLKKFTAKKNLLKHLRDVHKNFSEAERMVIKKLKCPEKNCEFVCRMTRELRNHIEKSHKIKILKDTLQFPSEAVFQKWKKEEESNTVSWFVSGRRKATLTDGTKKQIFYCHRTGHYNPRGFGKYRMRTVGSCKIGVTCPAAMEVTESGEGELTVIYYKTHLGHSPDATYLKLSKEERNHLEEKIKQGFSFDSILEDVKESKDINNENKKRIHLLSKKDLYRIMYRSKKGINKKIGICEETSQNTISQKPLEVDGKELPVNNVQSKKTEENITENCQNITFYPSHSSVVSLQESSSNNQSSLSFLPQQISHRDVNIPQISKEGIASQIVILSPDVDYSSIPEIILLSAGNEVLAQPETLSQNKPETFGHQKAHSSESQTPISGEVPSPEHSTKGNKSKLYFQLKQKLHKILEFLPHSEHLTPRQFDLINTKLDGILSIFNVVNEKARTRKNNLRKPEVKRNQTLMSVRTAIGRNEASIPRLQGQQHYEWTQSPFIYAVYN